MKIFRIIKNHPKKIIFFSSLIGLGVNYGKGKYNEQCMMRAYCEEALKFGEVTHLLTDEERHVTVILNPAANNGKCFSKYEKFCAPLLHLAGMKVALVKTEHEDQAKQIMEVMDNTQAVIVAGGDGTLSEILTGLLRREDAQVAVRRFPLGILPLGESNSVASCIWGFNKTPEVQHLGEATMSIVRNMTKKMNVMQITPIEENETKKPVFAAAELEWGAFRDAKERKSVYWYWSFLKKYMVYVFSSYKDLTWDCSASVQYSLPCKGCSRCKVNEEKENLEALQKKPKRWWEAFVPRSKDHRMPEEEEQIDYSSIINEKCGEFQVLDIKNVCDVRISSSNLTDTKYLEGYSVSLRIGRPNLSALDFIQEGWKREGGEESSYEQELILGEILLIPSEEVKKDKGGKDRHLNIDNEPFELKSMKIRPRANAVTIFAPSQS